jgi:outer membrane receptor for ferrienterochelin and colicin
MKPCLTKLFLWVMILACNCITAEGQRNVQPNLDSFSLKDLLNVKITTASKTSQALELASAVVQVITKDQIRTRNYQSLLDVLYDLPDVKVDDKMYSGMRNSVTIRGTQGSEKFIILMDGINIGSPSGEAMPVMHNYPVHLAEQIEILYGPASALYGADAVSGIINIITRKPAKKGMTLDMSSTGGNYGYTNNTLFLSKKLGPATGLVLSAQYHYDRNPDYSKIYKKDSLSDISSYKAGVLNTIYGPVMPQGPFAARYEAPVEAYNIYAALRSGDFSFSIFRNYTRLPTAWGNNTRNSIFNKDVYMAQSVTLANASYKIVSNAITSTTSLTASKYTLHPGSNYRNLYTFMEKGYKYSTCTMIKGEQQVDYKSSEKLNLTAGLGYENYTAVPQSADLASPVNTRSNIQGYYLGTSAYYKPEGLPAPFYLIQYYNLGSYLQAQYSPGNQINFTIGARYDRNSRFGSSFNPRLGIVYQPSASTTMKLLYGRAFRAPAPSESHAQYGSFETADSGRTYHSYFLHLPNMGLKPVTSDNFELNIQQRLSDNLILSFDGYFTALKGLYAFANDNETTHIYNNQFNGIPVDYIEVFVNSDRQKNFGGSIQLKWKHNVGYMHLNCFGSVSYVNGLREKGLKESVEEDKDMQLDFISPWMFRVGTDIKMGKLSFSPRLLLASRQNIAGLGDTTGDIIKRQTIGGYTLLNLSLRYTMTRNLSFFTTITNALDQRYRMVSFNMDLTKKDTELYYGQPQDPIRIMTGLNLYF